MLFRPPQIVPLLLGSKVPGWVKAGASIDLDFANGRYFGGSPASSLTIVRASTKTDLLPSSASGATFNTFGNNVLAITPGLGILIEEARTNQLLNSNAPATQTTGSLGTGTYTLWVNGSGSATPSGNTATITGAAAATNGSPNTFTVTVAGTIDVTVSGSLNAFQLEQNTPSAAQGTSFIVTVGGTATRAADSVLTTGFISTILAGSAKSILAVTSKIPGVAAQRTIVSGGGGSAPEYLYFNSTSGPLDNYSGASVLADGTVTSNNLNKSALGADGTGRSLVANNGTVATDTNTQHANSTSALGASAGVSAFINGYISRITLWTTRLSDAMLKAVTT